MIIVIDTNILISALIKDSSTRRIIIESGLRFAYPEISLQEVLKHEAEILEKGEYDEATFHKILDTLLEYINLIPLEVIKPELELAKDAMEKIDISDAIFLAAALALEDAAIWSEDGDFEHQNLVRVFKTKDMIKFK